MNLLHLKYALEVAKTGSITQAAENLYMGQPNLSKAIRELETSLGLSLFARSSKGVVATAAGEAFLEHARAILAQVQEIEALYKGSITKKPAFTIGAPDVYYITNIFAEYIAKKAKEGFVLDVSYVHKTEMELINSVANEEVSCGILRYPKSKEHYYLNVLQEKELDRKKIWRFAPVVYMKKTHPLAYKPKINKEDLQMYTQIYAASMQMQLLLEDGANLGRVDSMQINTEHSDLQMLLLQNIDGAYAWGTPMPEKVLDSKNLVTRSCLDTKGILCDVFIYPKGYTLTSFEEEFSIALEAQQALAVL